MTEAKRERRRRGSMISVRVTPEEEAKLRTVAAERGTSLSKLLREAALAHCRVEDAAITVDLTSTAGLLPTYAEGSQPGKAIHNQTRTMILTMSSERGASPSSSLTRP